MCLYVQYNSSIVNLRTQSKISVSYTPENRFSHNLIYFRHWKRDNLYIDFKFLDKIQSKYSSADFQKETSVITSPLKGNVWA